MDRSLLAAQLHRRAFRVSHALGGNPLFHLDALLDVARAAAERPGDLYFDAGDVGLTDKWGAIERPALRVEQLIENIAQARAWIVLKHVERDPRYARVLDEWAQFVRELAGPGAARLKRPEMLVFITSPRRITPFHFDAEVNFLVQLTGSKDLWVCDPNDRELTTELELERYYSLDITAGTYKEQAPARAQHFSLVPGDAVHIPSHAAHWVQNHDAVSISLSLNFELPPRPTADAYRANHLLRSWGMRPTPVGTSALLDQLKASTLGFAVRANGGLRARMRAARARAHALMGRLGAMTGFPSASADHAARRQDQQTPRA